MGLQSLGEEVKEMQLNIRFIVKSSNLNLQKNGGIHCWYNRQTPPSRTRNGRWRHHLVDLCSPAAGCGHHRCPAEGADATTDEDSPAEVPAIPPEGAAPNLHWF